MSNIKKNYAYSMVYQILQMIMPLITAPYVARVIGSEGVGVFSYTRSIAYYFMLLGMLGINNYGNREIARVRDNQSKMNTTFSELYSVQLFTSFVFIFLYVVIFIVINKENKLLYFSQLPYILSAAFDINWLFFGLEKFKITVSRKVFIKCLTTLGVFLLVRDHNDVLLYSWVMNAGYLIGQGYLLFSLNRYVRFSKQNLSYVVSKHWKPLFILFIPILATSIYRVMDKVMLGTLLDHSEVGIYENADKIVVVLLGVVSAWGNVMLPRISNLYANEKFDECKKCLVNSMEFINCITLAMAFGIASISSKFVVLFYGAEFKGSGPVLCGLAITIVFIGWSNTIRNQVLIPMKKDNIFVRSVVGGAFVNLVVNILLIPRFGSIGAMLGTITAEFSVALFQIIPIRREIQIGKMIFNLLPFLSIGGLMYLIVVFIGMVYSGSLLFTVVLQIVFGAIIYGLFSFIYFWKKRDSFAYSYLHKFAAKLKKNR